MWKTSGLMVATASLWVSALSAQANAELIQQEMRPGEVFAACHYSSNGQVRNDILQFFTDTEEVWFGDTFSGTHKAGSIIFADDRLLAAEVSIAGPLTVYYIASILIDRKSRKYLKSEIAQRDCETLAGCEYETASFEGECHQIFGDFER